MGVIYGKYDTEMYTELSWKPTRPKHRRKVNIKIGIGYMGWTGLNWVCRKVMP